MKVETYQGFEINFDENIFKFTTPNGLEAASLPGIKRAINVAIKTNSVFDTPIKVYEEKHRTKFREIISINNKKNFITKDGSEISHWYEDGYIIYDKSHEKIFPIIDKLRGEERVIINLLDEKQREINAQLAILRRRTLTTLKSEIQAKG